ncbi:hypothetical protein ACWC4C_05480 [Streptomyces olivaceoviridis]|uniref:hypothetical protein n=1 Tax=Streptomyces olivaceoviridis TaxID=1921 RepID=UPI000310362A
MKHLGLALLAVVVLAGVSLGTGTAYANDFAETVTCATVSTQDPTDGDKLKLAATACFHSYGDYFTLKDENSDGYHAEVWWQTDYGRVGACKNTEGAGKTVTCNYDMKEGHRVGFTAFAVDNGTVIMGGAEKEATI